MDKKSKIIFWFFLLIGMVLGILFIAHRTPKAEAPKENPPIEVKIPKVEYEVWDCPDCKG